MKSVFNHKALTLAILVTVGLGSCQQPEGNVTGSEYMPDMAHSLAYESNHYNYYYHNTWGSEEEYHKFAQPRKPVEGTVARGEAAYSLATSHAGAVKSIAESRGVTERGGIAIPVNGSVPYYYPNTEEGRASAMADIINNPFPITDAGLAEGKELYDVFCGICHGEKGDGAGYLVRDGGKYPAQPANFLLAEHVNASNGRYYHAIIHGRNLMGAYADKISYEERWQVIHYIRALQAKEAKVDYNQLANGLNSIEVPAGAAGDITVEQYVATVAKSPAYKGHKGGHHGHDDHGHDDHGHESHDHGDKHSHDEGKHGDSGHDGH